MFSQEPPFCIQVEFSEGCNLYCDFCGLQGIRTKTVKNFKFMSRNTARLLANQIASLGWNSRIEFAMHGEPTMNPHFIELVSIFREELPKNQLMMTSNGGGLLGGDGPLAKLNALFDAGLNVYGLDAYESVNIAPKIMKAISTPHDVHEDAQFNVMYYPEDKEASIHKRWPRGTRLFVRVKDISVADEGNHATLNNHCGSGAPGLPEPMQSRCAKPFREISVRYNGKISICCNDWRGVYKCGDIHSSTIGNIWNNDAFNAARKYLYQGDRGALSPCDVCDAKSYRVGFLPDKKGKQELAKPTKKDAEIVAAATKGRGYAVPVKREWEKRR